MELHTINIMTRFSREGVLHREETKNDMRTITRLIRLGFLRKVHRNKKVFYELTDTSLPILESMRKLLLEEIKILAEFHKPPSFFHALLDDVRFLNDKHPLAKLFMFLGDWQINRPVVPSQLELAKLRYYKKIFGEKQ